jgi:hypothetical protein
MPALVAARVSRNGLPGLTLFRLREIKPAPFRARPRRRREPLSSGTNGTVRPLAASPARVTPGPGRIDHHVCDYIARARLKPAAWKHDPRVQNPGPKALAREEGSVRRCSPLTFPESAGAALRVWVMFGWPARPHCRLRREYAAAQPRRARRGPPGPPGPPPAPGPRHARHWPPGTRPRRPGTPRR